MEASDAYGLELNTKLQSLLPCHWLDSEASFRDL